MQRRKNIAALIIMPVLLASITISGCGNRTREEHNPGDTAEPEAPAATDTFDIPEIPAAAAPGTAAIENKKAIIDFSNAREGYIMAKFNQDTGKEVRALVVVPDGTQYQYRLIPGGSYDVLPLSGGDGEYTFSIWEHAEESKFALVLTATVTVTLDNEFVPFIRPNKFVSYDRGSKAVRKAAELASDADSPMEIISAVYNYIIANITYDEELAQTVQSGYLPDLDAVLDKGTGICFDYAALMTAMLRSQGIPTKLVFGYTGDEYHAWISVYTSETGWLDNTIYFDGLNWSLMDPTFAAGEQTGNIADYIADSSNYTVKFMY